MNWFQNQPGTLSLGRARGAQRANHVLASVPCRPKPHKVYVQINGNKHWRCESTGPTVHAVGRRRVDNNAFACEDAGIVHPFTPSPCTLDLLELGAPGATCYTLSNPGV